MSPRCSRVKLSAFTSRALPALASRLSYSTANRGRAVSEGELDEKIRAQESASRISMREQSVRAVRTLLG